MMQKSVAEPGVDLLMLQSPPVTLPLDSTLCLLFRTWGFFLEPTPRSCMRDGPLHPQGRPPLADSWLCICVTLCSCVTIPLSCFSTIQHQMTEIMKFNTHGRAGSESGLSTWLNIGKHLGTLFSQMRSNGRGIQAKPRPYKTQKADIPNSILADSKGLWSQPQAHPPQLLAIYFHFRDFLFTVSLCRYI